MCWRSCPSLYQLLCGISLSPNSSVPLFPGCPVPFWKEHLCERYRGNQTSCFGCCCICGFTVLLVLDDFCITNRWKSSKLKFLFNFENYHLKKWSCTWIFFGSGKYLKIGVKKSEEPEYLVQRCWNKILWLLLSSRISGLKLNFLKLISK